MFQRQTHTEAFWAEQFEVTSDDLDHVQTLLLSDDHPRTTRELALELVRLRVAQEDKAAQKAERARGMVYRPVDLPEPGQPLSFPELDFAHGEVTVVRDGQNPDDGLFKVITVRFSDGTEREFVADLPEHALNDVADEVSDDAPDELRDPDYLVDRFRKHIWPKLEAQLREQDLIRLAGRWFFRSMLIQIDEFNRNLAEAVLYMHDGGPLSTEALLKELELKVDAEHRLQVFSLDFALQADERFDEVGPAGEVMWYLKSFEPPEVLTPPKWLTPSDDLPDVNLPESLHELVVSVDDELSDISRPSRSDTVTVAVSYPHLKAGTLPLSSHVQHLFPMAYSAPRIRFTLVDKHSKERLPGWVVTEGAYVWGLASWYDQYGAVPGTLVSLQRGETVGEVIVEVQRQRTKKEWLRTVRVDDRGHVRFTTEQHPIRTPFDEETVLIVEDGLALERAWDTTSRQPLTETVRHVFHELSKLGAQQQVHAKTLHASVNALRRTTPEAVFATLLTIKGISHMGDAYWVYENEEAAA